MVEFVRHYSPGGTCPSARSTTPLPLEAGDVRYRFVMDFGAAIMGGPVLSRRHD